MAPTQPRGRWIAAVYGLLLLLLPPRLRREDGEVMRGVLEEQLDGEARWAGRLRLGARAWVGLVGVAGAEWWDAVRPGGVPGAVESTKGRSGMGRWLKDLTWAVRGLVRSPGFTVGTVLLMGLGIGIVTTVFTVVDHVVLRPLPYPAQDRLVYLSNGSHNGPTLTRMDGVEAFEVWAPSSVVQVNLTRADGEPLTLRSVETTADFFSMYGGRPVLGRLLLDADEDARDVTVLSHGAWQEIWGGDPEIVGSVIRIDDRPLEVVGILAGSFQPPAMVTGPDVHLFRPMDWTDPALADADYHRHNVTARLMAGRSLEAAQEEIDRVASDVAQAYPDRYQNGPSEHPLLPLHERTVQFVRSGLWLLLGSVGLLLLVACTNVAHLFMARGLARSREMAIRRAMGAGSSSLLSQLAVESLVVGLLGGALGLAMAHLSLGALTRWTEALPRGGGVETDFRIFLFAAALAVATALAFGLGPGLRSLSGDVQDALRGGGRAMTGGRRVQAFRSGLVVGEVAVSLVLVATAGLLMRSFQTVTAQDPGLETDGVWMVPVSPTGVETADQYRTRMEAVRQALEAVPGVAEVTYGIEAPFEHVGGNMCCWGTRIPASEEGMEGPSLSLSVHPVASRYFETYGTELVAGAVWNASTAEAEPAPGVISEALAVRRFGSPEAALGRPLGGEMSVTVVAVAEQTLHYGLDQSHDYALYLPMAALTFPIPRATFALKIPRPDEGTAAAVRRAVWSAEPSLPIPTVATLASWIDESSATRRFGSALFGAFGAVALLLACAGLYGTLLYTVGQRRKELGIRMALGADRGRIQGQVVRRGLTQAVLGVALGGGIAWALSRLLESFLFGVSATDPLALSGAALILLATSVAASWFPARRAARTDPMETLQAE